jgi:hypothetical protein
VALYSIAFEALRSFRGGKARVFLKSMQLRNRTLFCTLGLLLLPMCGCQSVETSQQNSLLRVLDASSNAPPVDLVVGGDTEFTNLSGPSISNYAPLNTGTSTLTLRATGTTTGGAASLLDAKAGQEYSLLLLDQGSSYVSSILEDQSVSAPTGDVSLRFITDTPVAGALDVYLVPTGTKIAKATPVETDIVSGTVTAYVNVSEGAYDLITTFRAGPNPGAYRQAVHESGWSPVGGGERSELRYEQRVFRRR